MEDNYSHIILKGEHYLKGNYLRKGRSKTIAMAQLYLIEGTVFITPDEVYEAFVDINKDLQLPMDTYKSMIAGAQ